MFVEERVSPLARLTLTTPWYSDKESSWSNTWLLDTGLPTGYTVK